VLINRANPKHLAVAWSFDGVQSFSAPLDDKTIAVLGYGCVAET
jgi:hypothetical protein